MQPQPQLLPCRLQGGQLLYYPLPPVERSARRAQEQAARQAALGLLLGSECSLAHYPSGAPYLPEHPEWALSLSHSPRALVLLLYPQRSPREILLGVDLEEEREQLDRVAARYLHEGELSLLEHAGYSPRRARCLLWAAKEAAYKAYQPASGSLLSFRLEEHRAAHQELILSYGRHRCTMHYQPLEQAMLCYTAVPSSSIQS